jgi:hypothetical protein
LVVEIEVSENKEAVIVLAGTIAGAAATFVASLPIPLETAVGGSQAYYQYLLAHDAVNQDVTNG